MKNTWLNAILVLYKKSFEFNDEHFLQISGVPMGQKSSGSICNLVVHELEKKDNTISEIYTHAIQIHGQHARLLVSVA